MISPRAMSANSLVILARRFAVSDVCAIPSRSPEAARVARVFFVPIESEQRL